MTRVRRLGLFHWRWSLVSGGVVVTRDRWGTRAGCAREAARFAVAFRSR